MNVEGAGIKRAVWSNWVNYFLVLFICTVELAACDVRRVGVNDMSHRPSDMLRLSVRMIFLFLSNT